MLEFETILKYSRSTKGTHIYKNDEFPGIYIPKRVFKGSQPPSEIVLNLCDVGYTIPKEGGEKE